jgi:hypothetical protein
MFRHRLVSAGQPLPLRVVLGFVEILASSATATVVIALGAIVLAWATWLGDRWGDAAVQWGIYQSRWFAAILGFLGLNVLAAAIVRFPWRGKIGFLIVHSGILILLVGCWLDRQSGVNARLSLFEGERSSRAVDDSRRELALTLVRPGPDGRREQSKPIPIPFVPGVFNWEDYDALAWFPWHVAQRDGGILYDRDGVQVEALDYLADSQRLPVPRLRLRVASDEGAGAAERMTLAVREIHSPHSSHPALTVGSREQTAGGTWIVFRLSGSQAETDAFLKSAPEGPLGRLGQIVLWAKGKRHCLRVENLLKKGPVPLGSSGLRVELVGFDPAGLRVVLKTDVEDKKDSVGEMWLSAVEPQSDQQDSRNGVAGSYWCGPSEERAENKTQAKQDKPPAGATAKAAELIAIPPEAAQAAAEPRVDILLGQDGRLQWRAWRDGRMEPGGELARDGSKRAVFSGSDAAMTMSVESLAVASRSSYEVVPLPFDKEKLAKMATRERVKVRLTVDGNAREFWLTDPAMSERDEGGQTVEGKGRVATIEMSRPVVDLGFRVGLRQFSLRFKPGTSEATYYESRVDFLSAGAEAKPLRKDVSIPLNCPASAADPTSGRVYRFFQGGYQGPFGPGRQEFDDHAAAGDKRDRIYLSHLIVSYDPGRSLKYAGCLMILVGIVVLYAMRVRPSALHRKRG